MNNKPDIIQWCDMPTNMQDIVLNSHARHHNTEKKEALRKAFDDGNQLIICGMENKKVFTQIHPTSTVLMAMLIKQCLHNL